MPQKTAIIIGAGPAGLTAAYELLVKTDIKPIIFEAAETVGGLAKTIIYKGNRLDAGGHRFFSKSKRVMDWWLKILPLQGAPAKDDILLQRNLPFSEKPKAPDPEKVDQVMLRRNRFSRIFFLRKFFDYPVSFSWNTFFNLGLMRIFKIFWDYLKIRLWSIKKEKSLEDFFINRFGRELYLTFFKDYTEKVWGVACRQIKPEWGAQKVKGFSITKAIIYALKKLLFKKNSNSQKSWENSFFYPKFGPGQFWETVASIIKEKSGEIFLSCEVIGFESAESFITGIKVKDKKTGEIKSFKGDYFFSTMPVKDLIPAFDAEKVPQKVKQVAQGLAYRSFITVGLLLKKLKIKNTTKIKTINNIIPDNWVYIQEKDVKFGRLQIFNNWSPYLVQNDKYVWIGLEYFCDEGDELWNKTDANFIQFAIEELVKLNFIDQDDVLDYTVIKMPKTYPGYFGSYENFVIIREFTDRFENLFLIGRNGMHRYNNMDHSMLSAMTAVENIINSVKTKNNIWSVDTEEEYYEQT